MSVLETNKEAWVLSSLWSLLCGLDHPTTSANPAKLGSKEDITIHTFLLLSALAIGASAVLADWHLPPDGEPRTRLASTTRQMASSPSPSSTGLYMCEKCWVLHAMFLSATPTLAAAAASWFHA